MRAVVRFVSMHDAEDAQMDELYAVFARAKSRAKKAAASIALLRCAEPFLGRVVQSFSRRGPIAELEREDAMQGARVGFLEALRRIDPMKGPLRPYAIKWIRNELQKQAEYGNGIKIPRQAGLDARAQRTIELIWSREGREPTPEELNGSWKAFQEAPLRPKIVGSLDVRSFDEDNEMGRFAVRTSVSTEGLDALDQLIAAEDREPAKRLLRFSDRVLSSRQKAPVMPDPKPPSPIAALQRAIEDVRSHVAKLDARIAELQKERIALEEQARSVGLQSLSPVTADLPRPIPILRLNQDHLSNRIVAFLRDHPNARIPAIAQETEEDPSVVYGEIRKLRRSKLIAQSGKARATRYRLSASA